MESNEISESASAGELYFEVNALYESGQYEKAVKIYEILNKKYPHVRRHEEVANSRQPCLQP